MLILSHRRRTENFYLRVPIDISNLAFNDDARGLDDPVEGGILVVHTQVAEEDMPLQGTHLVGDIPQAARGSLHLLMDTLVTLGAARERCGTPRTGWRPR